MCKSNKMFKLTILILCLSGVLAAPKSSQRIIGGSITTIAAYPYGASLLYSSNYLFYSQACGGTLLTTRTILSAAHCFYGDKPSQWRVRLGSTFANRGGSVYSLSSITIHKNYNQYTLDSDVALLKTDKTIKYVTGAIQPANIAGANYNLGDNQPVFAIGWGVTSTQGGTSTQLRHVQVWTVNQAVCRSRYAEVRLNITDNMLCSGWLDVGGRDQCSGDSGGPLIHNNVIVGICSWGKQCALPRYPGVNTRVSKFVQWIVSNA